MEFQSMYDEDLSQNKFFQKIQCEHKILIDTAPLENWIICVPRSATIKPNNLIDTDFLLAHVLIPHDEITEQYTNLLAADIKQIDGKLIMRNVVSSILFEEVFYTKGLIKYKVWCIEVPLMCGNGNGNGTGHGPNDYCVHATEPPAGLFIVRGLTDAMALIWNETNSKTVFRKIENICCSFMRNTNCTSQLMLDPSMLSDDTNAQCREKDLQRIKRSVEILFNHCFKKLMYQRRLHEKCVRDAHFRRVFKIALETYIMDILYRWIFDAITLCYANETETFNVVLRNLSDTNLKHFKIDSRCNDIIVRVRTELLKITEFTTPIEKISCLRRALTAASQCKHNDISVDDLIPILVFVIVKSGLTHWITTLHFLQNFIFTEFSDGSDKGVDSFLITTLEAAILYIKSINLNEFRANAPYDVTIKCIEMHQCVRQFADKEQFIEYLFAKIRCEDEVEIIKLLKIDKNVEIATVFGAGGNNANDNNDMDGIEDIILIKSIDSDNDYDANRIVIAIADVRNDDDDEGVANDIDNIISEFPQYRVNLQNNHGIGAIHVAAMHGSSKMLNLLLVLGADPDTQDENNFTPLHYAAARGHQNTLLLLMHAGVDVSAVTNDKNTALHLCCLNGHLNCVKALLYYSDHMKVKIDRNAQNRMGDTAIHMATKWGFRDIVEVLLEYGVKTDLENRIGDTALDYAHNSHIAAMLQNAFVVINTTSTENGTWEDASYAPSTTALNHQEVFRGCFTSSVASVIDETANEAFIHKTPNDKIVAAIRNNDTKLAYHFLGIELPDQLMPAICHPLCDCAKCKLISLQMFNRCESKQMMQVYDGNIDERTVDGVTVLQTAIQKQHIELIEAILKLNAAVSPQAQSTRQTAIHFAVHTKSVTILDLVLMHADDGDIDVQDANGDTAMHVAVKLTDIHLVECLLKHEPNVRQRNNDGKTPADIARTMLQVNIARLLDIADSNRLK